MEEGASLLQTKETWLSAALLSLPLLLRPKTAQPRWQPPGKAEQASARGKPPPSLPSFPVAPRELLPLVWNPYRGAPCPHQ